ncbi:hypothetical protein BDF19DRAFT_440956 [Syncephalis fuscata]|nr:hypothetical protein BDF19DRAFT_440956 [Syncephalis fuscata]
MFVVLAKAQANSLRTSIRQLNLWTQFLDYLTEVAQQQLVSSLSQEIALADQQYWERITIDTEGNELWEQPELLSWISETFLHLNRLILAAVNRIDRRASLFLESSQHDQFMSRVQGVIKTLLPSSLWPMAFYYSRNLLQTFEDIQRDIDHLPLPKVTQPTELISALDKISNELQSVSHDASIYRTHSEERSQQIEALKEMRQIREQLTVVDGQWLRQIVIKVSTQAMEYLVYSMTRGSFDTSVYSQCNYWLNHVLLPWIYYLFYYGMRENSSFFTWRDTLAIHLSRSLANIRISELFNIIVEYPACKGALEDLKICLKTPRQRDQLVAALSISLEKRLLHPGADTSDILMHYVSMIRCLRFIDPPGTLLERVADPVRNYLRQRDDTIRCIAEDLMNESRSDLIEELTAGDAMQGGYTSDSEDEDGDDADWEPIPIDAGPRLDTLHRRNADAISMLISIYKTRDVFVKAFQAMFAERLLAIDDYDTEKEIRNLEMLKLRFGETNLQSCEVMIKDFADSKRFEQYLHQDQIIPNDDESTLLRPIVLSRLSWPEFKSETFNLPDVIDELCTASSDAFTGYKPRRKLKWVPQVGSVHLELEFDERKVEFHVSPPHATVIMAFDDHDIWDISELSDTLQMPLPQLRRRLYFWCSHGILKEQSIGRFTIQSSLEEHEDAQGAMLADETNGDGVASTSTSSAAAALGLSEEEAKLYWNIIKNMLSSMGPQPLERIHTTLTMFLQGPIKFTKSSSELRDMLDSMVTEEKLLWVGGQYRLKS